MKKGVLIFTIIVACFVCFYVADGQADIMYNPDFDIKSPGVKLIIVGPPGIFTLPGSQTTNFIQVCSLGEAFNLVLDVAGKNMVRFDDPIVDMCDNETIQNLDNYIQMDKVGEVSIDSEVLSYLKDASAQVTMRNLPFEQEPEIEVDGRPATAQDIENKQWNKDSKTLEFKAKHFTVYKAVAASVSLAGEENELSGVPVEETRSNTWIFALIGAVIIVTVALAVILGKKKIKVE